MICSCYYVYKPWSNSLAYGVWRYAVSGFGIGTRQAVMLSESAYQQDRVEEEFKARLLLN